MSNTRYFRKRREILMAQDPHCYWCGVEVIYFRIEQIPRGEKLPHNFATIDHLIDRYDAEARHEAWKNKQPNTVLACYSCNHKRAKLATERQSKDALRIRDQLARERITLGSKLDRPQTFRGLTKMNEWDQKEK